MNRLCDPAFSPASSMSSTDTSPVPSPSTDSECGSVEEAPRTPRRRSIDEDDDERPAAKRCRNYYEELLRPLTPIKTLPPTRPYPKPTHKPHYDRQLQTQFHRAVDEGNYAELDDLLAKYSERIDINLYNEDGQTPLQSLCSHGNLSLIKLLVRYGADVRLRTREGWSPIHIASFSGRVDVLTFISSCAKR